MANEIWTTFSPSFSLYALVWLRDDSEVWNDLDEAFEPYTEVRLDEYDIPLINPTGLPDYYSVGFPTAIVESNVYNVQIMLQAGASPASADFGIAQGEMQWGGTEEINILNLLAQGSRVLNKYPTRSQPDG